MRSNPISGLAALLISLSLANCSNGELALDGIPGYLKNTWGIQFAGFEGDFAVAPDGTQTQTTNGTITVDGLGSGDLSVKTIVAPMATGGDTTLVVANPASSELRYFHYDQVQNYVSVGDGTNGIAVSKNPDGVSYDVWGFLGDTKTQTMTVPNGLAALRLVEQYGDLKSISPYIVLTAFSLAHTQAPEARTITTVRFGTAAAMPVVCDIFKEFCDCAACLVLKREGACNVCPNL